MPHAEHVVVDQMIVLGGRFVMPSHRRPHEVASVTGRESGRPYTCRVPANTTFTSALWLRHASSTVSWLRQLISRSVYGSRMLSMWLT